MAFHVVYSGELRQKIATILNKAKPLGQAKELGRTFSILHERMTQAPVASGEPRYSMKHVDLKVYDTSYDNLAVRYAVDEAGKNVLVMWFVLYGRHPYPAEFETILNPKKPSGS